MNPYHPDYLNYADHADHDPALDIYFQPKPTNRMNTTAMEKLPVPETPAEMLEQLTEVLGKMSGGEIPLEQRAEYIRLRDLIKREEDVFDVIALSRRCDGTWLYYIRTPFVSYPKFVIGETTAENEVTLPPLFRSGMQWSADAEWDRLRHGKGVDA
jgi:hypothetical protein